MTSEEIAIIGTVVASLDRLEAILPAVKDLGDGFTAETRAAWTKAYGVLSGATIAAAGA